MEVTARSSIPRLRELLFLPLIFLATTSISAPANPSATIMARPVMLDPSNPGRARLGALRFLGGWELTSSRPDFGGISALHVRDGHIFALSDTGTVIRFRMKGGAISDVRFQILPSGPGTGAGKSDRDTEAFAIDSVTGSAWVGFERHNAIWRYSADFARASGHVEPSAMRNWPSNNGPEALVRLADGRFIVLAEARKSPEGTSEGLLFAADPTLPGPPPVVFTYRGPAGFLVTDAAQLPDGRLIILHRDFSIAKGVAAVLSLVDPRMIKAGAVLEGRPIARFAPPLTVDNMEALAVDQVGGRTILWLASDDNFSPLQRTLLMKFELVE